MRREVKLGRVCHEPRTRVLGRFVIDLAPVGHEDSSVANGVIAQKAIRPLRFSPGWKSREATRPMG